MKLTIDNNDGNGPIDYTSSIVAGRPFRIVRKLNQPVTCGVTLLPASGLATPARNGRVVVADDSGNVLFTGYVATEPALELAGQGTMGAVYQAVVSAISDEILLDRQSIPQIAPLCGTTGGQAIQAMLALLDIEAITASVASATMNVSEFQSNSNCTWSENAGALAASVRSAYLLMNGTLSMTPVGSVTHSLSESQGTLSLSGLQVAMVKALANDVTVCGEVEPSAYVTEFFQGDGTTVLFDLTEAPWMPPPSKTKPLSDNFQGPTDQLADLERRRSRRRARAHLRRPHLRRRRQQSRHHQCLRDLQSGARRRPRHRSGRRPVRPEHLRHHQWLLRRGRDHSLRLHRRFSDRPGPAVRPPSLPS